MIIKLRSKLLNASQAFGDFEDNNIESAIGKIKSNIQGMEVMVSEYMEKSEAKRAQIQESLKKIINTSL